MCPAHYSIYRNSTNKHINTMIKTTAIICMILSANAAGPFDKDETSHKLLASRELFGVGGIRQAGKLLASRELFGVGAEVRADVIEVGAGAGVRAGVGVDAATVASSNQADYYHGDRRLGSTGRKLRRRHSRGSEHRGRGGFGGTAGASADHGRLGGTTYSAGAGAGGYHQGRFGRHGSAGGAGAGVQYQKGPRGHRSVSAGGAAAGGHYRYQ